MALIYVKALKGTHSGSKIVSEHCYKPSVVEPQHCYAFSAMILLRHFRQGLKKYGLRTFRDHIGMLTSSYVGFKEAQIPLRVAESTW